MRRFRRLHLGVLVGAMLLAGAGCRSRSETPTPEESVAAAGPRFQVELYFPGEEGLLVPERREVEAASESLGDQAAAIARAVLAGPEGSGLAALFERPVTLGSCFVDEGAVVYLDLRSEEGSPPPGMGSNEEMLVVYSLVNSVALNLADVRRVVLLWNGRQPATFGGHLDTGKPLGPLRSLIRP